MKDDLIISFLPNHKSIFSWKLKPKRFDIKVFRSEKKKKEEKKGVHERRSMKRRGVVVSKRV